MQKIMIIILRLVLYKKDSVFSFMSTIQMENKKIFYNSYKGIDHIAVTGPAVDFSLERRLPLIYPMSYVYGKIQMIRFSICFR